MGKAHRKSPEAHLKASAGGAEGAALLAWYHKNARALPWRYPPGVRGDPYRIWLSEIMLQQTTVVTVKPYFEKFLAKWPTVETLAAAKVEDVLAAWAGLGYYSRARNLHACAQAVVQNDQGHFPRTIDDLKKLPGIGPYTASAVAAIAFGANTVPVDGNVERVMARFYALNQPVRAIKPEIKRRAQAMLDAVPERDPGDFAQALMDLGATICTPKSPKCLLCPLRPSCRAFARKNQENYPVQPQKTLKPIRYGTAYIVQNDRGQIGLVRRSEKGLLAGMMGLPTTEWTAEKQVNDLSFLKLINAINIGHIRHVFTHFNLVLDVVRGDIKTTVLPDAIWYNEKDSEEAGLPTVFLKALRLAFPGKNDE